MAPKASDDTIFALSSAPGRAGISVVRVSGTKAGDAIEALTGQPPPEPRRASLRTLLMPGGPVIDQALVLFFRCPASATGEDVAEFHVHGGRAVIEAVLKALAGVAGLRPAEPGEFTRRAVEHGKLDLTRAEGLADLIDAETDAQRLQALRQYDGALAALYDGWRERLIRICAWAEAEIDFSDEEIDGDLEQRVRESAREILEEIQAHLADARVGEITREGILLTVIGKPNSGKSSLVNALARRDIAIVSPTPGTTRDVLETRLNLGGYAVILADTAGLRAVAEDIEAEGVRRALARAEQADLVLLLLDGTDPEPFSGLPPSVATRLARATPPPHAGEEILERALSFSSPACGGGAPKARRGESDTLLVWNKSDLPWPTPREGLKISARTGEGLDALVERLVELVRERLERPCESPPITRARHRHALQTTTDELARAITAGPGQLELLAEDLRLALRSLGRITGRVDIEVLLDVVFRDFCIGK